jgi:hypothetical protein
MRLLPPVALRLLLPAVLPQLLLGALLLKLSRFLSSKR